jgi:hypothetical protein
MFAEAATVKRSAELAGAHVMIGGASRVMLSAL